MLNQNKSIEKLNLTGYQKSKKNPTIFFIIEKAKETVLHFSKGVIKILWFYFVLI